MTSDEKRQFVLDHEPVVQVFMDFMEANGSRILLAQGATRFDRRLNLAEATELVNKQYRALMSYGDEDPYFQIGNVISQAPAFYFLLRYALKSDIIPLQFVPNLLIAETALELYFEKHVHQMAEALKQTPSGRDD